ncbi:MAG: hypothetical protein QM493_02130 [Sulfurovum sp.]
MNRFFTLLGLVWIVSFSMLSADGLTNSLNTILNQKDKKHSLNLNNIHLDGKPRYIKKAIPKRSKRAVVATINGEKIRKKEADNYLKKRTKGKVKNFDALARKQKRSLIKELAYPILISQKAQKDLSNEEKEAVYSRTWMQKQAQGIKISDDDAMVIYKQIEIQAEDKNETDRLLPFESVKNKIKSQMLEKRILGKLMKDVEINIL